MMFGAYTSSKDPDQTTKSHNLGPVVQSIVSLTSSLVVKMLTVLVSTISSSQVFLLKKNVSDKQYRSDQMPSSEVHDLGLHCLL